MLVGSGTCAGVCIGTSTARQTAATPRFRRCGGDQSPVKALGMKMITTNLMLALAMLCFATSCNAAADQGDKDNANNSSDKPMAKTYKESVDQKLDNTKTYIATIETTAGTMKAELYPNIAPKTVNSFVFLSREGFYEGVIFHRV